MRYNRPSRRTTLQNYFNRQRQRRRQHQPQQQPRPQPQVSPQPPFPVPTIIFISSSSSTSFYNPSLLLLYRTRDFSYSRENQDLQNQVEDLQQQLDDAQANRNFWRRQCLIMQEAETRRTSRRRR